MVERGGGSAVLGEEVIACVGEGEEGLAVGDLSDQDGGRRETLSIGAMGEGMKSWKEG